MQVVDSGSGIGVVGSAPLWPTTITVDSDWAMGQDQTIEFWFKQEADSDNSYCVLSLGANKTNRMFIAVMRGTHASQAGRVYLSFAGIVNANWRTVQRYDDGEWHHCVIVLVSMYGVLNQFFYVDGELDSQNYTDRSPNMRTWNTTYIGDCSKFVAGYVIEGSPIDEIALYDYQLDTDRIQAHYNEVMAGPAGLEFSISSHVNVSGALKTNKRIRLHAAQIDVEGFIAALVLNNPLRLSISSQVDMSGRLKAGIAGKRVLTSARMQSNELDTIVQTGIGVRI